MIDDGVAVCVWTEYISYDDIYDTVDGKTRKRKKIIKNIYFLSFLLILLTVYRTVYSIRKYFISPFDDSDTLTTPHFLLFTIFIFI